MKHIACFLFTLLVFGNANAQVAQWLVPPEYDGIEISSDNNVIIAQQGFNRHIWDMNGKCLAKVTDDLYPFSEGYAVSTRPETAYVTAIYDTTGKRTPVSDPKIQLGWGYPLFHDNFLLISDGNYFYYMDPEGGVGETPYYNAYPFSHGYASCFTFANLRKMKDPMRLLIDTNLEPVELGWEGKLFPADDIEFISSVSDAGIGFVAYKSRLSPVLPFSGDTNIKNQARMDGDIIKAIVQIDDSTNMLTGKCGKARLGIKLDAVTLRPLSMIIGEEERSFQKNTAQTDAPTILKEVKNLTTGKYALHLGDTEILPPQLDGVERLKGNTALINMNDKLGLLRINVNDSLGFKINDGTAIGFRHKHFTTTIRLDLPSYIDANATSIEIDPQTGCTIDKASKVAKNSNEGNYLQYNCTLRCPRDVSDDIHEISYPANIVCEGLQLPMMMAKGKAWHSKYFAVDVNEHEVNLSGSTLTFTVNIDAERLPGEDVYPFIPSLVTDNLQFDMEKVTDTRYKCTVYNLKQGRNNIIVRVTEEGCPPSDYTFEVDNKPRVEQGQANVTMKKKKPTTPTPTTPTRPVLRI